ncbi:nucleotide-binding oligomerization domain-containing protein 2-like [Exaiptasia diaphana]|uniref:NACHT domain-containing protein n=1 Tax=Exaiptasia diaphana TaxID=2652724 RepID=A0A913XNS6_EXADI|nr:nucleotide-binding oligomerization domain-containing protein 2-like [Exaiptasia diaphana]
MDEEERNYCSLILLLSRVGLPKLRDFFINEWNSAGGFVPWTDCLQNGTDLLTKFTPLNYEKPKVQSGDTTTWDLSLFVKALLNSRPPFVPTTKKGLVAGLKCLKKTRNKLCHSPNGKIENSEFHNLKSSVCNSLMLIGASSKDFKKVKKDVQLPWNELISLVKQCASQDKDILQGIETIINRLERLQKGVDELQQGQKQSQQTQEEILQEIKNLQKPSTSAPSTLSCEDVKLYSERLKSSTKTQTEFQPKLLVSHSVPSTRTDDIFTNLMIQREWKPLNRSKTRLSRRDQLQEYNKPSAKQLIDKCQDMFINPPDHDNPNPKSILVIGKPGIGKSLFCQRLSRDWADGVLFDNNPDASRVADDFDFVFLMTFRQLNLFCEKQFNFCEVLNHCSVGDDRSKVSEPLFEYIIEHPEKVLFILDGYDEYYDRPSIFQCPFEQKYENNPRLKMPVAALISKLLQKKIFSSAVAMVTSRPTEADELGGIHMEAVVEIAGFSVEQVKEFIEKYFKSKKEEVKIAARDHIMNNENLLSIAHIPVLCHLMCFCLEWYVTEMNCHSLACIFYFQ